MQQHVVVPFLGGVSKALSYAIVTRALHTPARMHLDGRLMHNMSAKESPNRSGRITK